MLGRPVRHLPPLEDGEAHSMAIRDHRGALLASM